MVFLDPFSLALFLLIQRLFPNLGGKKKIRKGVEIPWVLRVWTETIKFIPPCSLALFSLIFFFGE